MAGSLDQDKKTEITKIGHRTILIEITYICDKGTIKNVGVVCDDQRVVSCLKCNDICWQCTHAPTDQTQSFKV